MMVDDIKEHEDGSVTIKFDLSEEEVKTLLQYALASILGKTALLNKMEMEETVEQLNATD